MGTILTLMRVKICKVSVLEVIFTLFFFLFLSIHIPTRPTFHQDFLFVLSLMRNVVLTDIAHQQHYKSVKIFAVFDIFATCWAKIVSSSMK